MLDTPLRRQQRGAGAGDAWLVFARHVAPARTGGQVDDELRVAAADRLDDARIEVELHRRRTGGRIAHMDVHGRGTGLAGRERFLGDLRWRDRQVRRLVRAREVAGDGAGENGGSVHEDSLMSQPRWRPPSATMTLP